MYGSLRDIITDSHFLIYASGIERNFARKHIAYVTDIVVRECVEGYVVVKGNRRREVLFVGKIYAQGN